MSRFAPPIVTAIASAAIFGFGCAESSQVPYDTFYLSASPAALAPVCDTLPFSIGARDDRKLDLGHQVTLTVSLTPDAIVLGCIGASICDGVTIAAAELTSGASLTLHVRAVDLTDIDVTVTGTCPKK